MEISHLRPRSVFICYGKEDVAAARLVYETLRRHGYTPWLDEECLLPGQKWRSAISRAIRECRFFIALLSSRVIQKRGSVNRQIAEALRILDEVPESEVFLIPARLDECEPSHAEISDLHVVDLFPCWEAGMEKLLRALSGDNSAADGRLESTNATPVPVTVQDAPPPFSSDRLVPHVRKALPIRALVMKGGGIKGLAYVGALEQLSKQYEFNWFIGTSAGAITAVLCGAGYTPSELLEILERKDFRDFFDAKWYEKPLNLIAYRGFHHANTLTEWLDELLAKKLKSPRRVRLSDLPMRVTIYASKRGTGALKFDSQDNDADAAYAARCSMSIPWVFVPQSNQGLRAYDGGIQHNYPVDRLLEDYPGTDFVSLYLGAEIYEAVKPTSVLADVISITTEGSDSEVIEKYRNRTVIIDPRPVGTLDFDLTEAEKTFLLAAGRVGALGHIDDTSEEYRRAVQERDKLRQSVEGARRAAATRRRRWRVCLFIVLLLCVGLVVWWSLVA